jgi:cytochrome c peroxidase
MHRQLLWSNLLLCLIACGSEPSSSFHNESVTLLSPPGFPALVFPQDNYPTASRIALGRALFYNRSLSKDEQTSCASCHVQSSAFTDGRSVSPGDNGLNGIRNAPTLTNLAWSPYLMSEGGVQSLELQALAPLHEPTEMGTNMMLAVERLNKDTELRQLNRVAYGRDSLDPYTITRALACFQRTLISGDSPYDQFKIGKYELSANEQQGMRLFFDKNIGCADCHREPFFTDYGFYNIGLYPWSVDPGLERKTHLPSDSGKFKTPTLRNIAVTAPYMHDGSMNSLEEVIGFYNSGGIGTLLQDQRIHPLHLTKEEEGALISFLNTLTDWNFLQNQAHTPPIQ